MPIFQLIDGNHKLSARQTNIGINKLKKGDKNNLKTYWEFIPVDKDKYYIKNSYFKSYLTLDNDDIYLSHKTPKTIWNNNLKSGDIYLSNDLKSSKKPNTWKKQPVIFNKNKIMTITGYICGSIVLIGLIILLIYYGIKTKKINYNLLIFIYLIFIIFTTLYLENK